MKITVARSGGFAGLTRSWVIVIDRDDANWVALLDDLPWGAVKLVSPQPDRFVYRIRVSRRQVILPEQQVSGPWRTLVDRVIDAAERDSTDSTDSTDRTDSTDSTAPGAR